MSVMTYFTNDGTYGDANKMVIVDTTHWSDVDWYNIDQSSDSERLHIALKLSHEKKGD